MTDDELCKIMLEDMLYDVNKRIKAGNSLKNMKFKIGDGLWDMLLRQIQYVTTDDFCATTIFGVEAERVEETGKNRFSYRILLQWSPEDFKLSFTNPVEEN